MAPYSDICSFVRLYKGSDSAVYTSVYKEKCLNWSHGRRETLLMTNRQLMLIVSLCEFFILLAHSIGFACVVHLKLQGCELRSCRYSGLHRTNRRVVIFTFFFDKSTI